MRKKRGQGDRYWKERPGAFMTRAKNSRKDIYPWDGCTLRQNDILRAWGRAWSTSQNWPLFNQKWPFYPHNEEPKFVRSCDSCSRTSIEENVVIKGPPRAMKWRKKTHSIFVIMVGTTQKISLSLSFPLSGLCSAHESKLVQYWTPYWTCLTVRFFNPISEAFITNVLF